MSHPKIAVVGCSRHNNLRQPRRARDAVQVGGQALRGLEDTALEIPVGLLLQNDTDPEGLNLTLSSVSSSINGDAVLSEDGATIVFTPDVDFWGEATFSYLVQDPEGPLGAVFK